MKGWGRLPWPVGALAAAAAGYVGASIPTWQAHPAAVVVVTRPVAAGQRVGSAVRRQVAPPPLPGSGPWWATQNLIPGEVLTTALVSTRPPIAHQVLVAVVPNAEADTSVATVGGWVEVLVVSANGLVWRSGPVPVLAVSAGATSSLVSGPGTVTVAMPPASALAYEVARLKGSVALVGAGP
ncbi:MAG: hypothetical protein K6U14_09725 [Firmicutes bacterium]|nr:hypothetical protein [Alicyclobacillaceae bacterium]MCL6497891.1 hypothetical protein [Bacillota bacterium]